ncbi:unnamed protein product [Alopecurus aequalis]
MHKEKGYAPRRDEVFVRTHMGKDGTVLNEETAKVIKDIDDAMEKHPELLEKSIQQGDILSHVLGKERNGYVRCVGLGTTASSLGMPGAQKLKSTKLQMAELEAAKARQSNDLLRNHIDELGEDTKAQLDAMMEEIANLRRMVSQSNAGNNVIMHTCEIQPEDSVGEYSTADQSLHDAHNIGEEDVVMQELKEAQEQYENKKAEAALLIRKKKEAAQQLNNEAVIQQKMREEDELKKRKEDELQKRKEDELQKRKGDELLKKKKKGEDMVQKKKDQGLQKKRETELQKKKEATTTQKNHQSGKEVILYSVYRDHSTPVAKATILSTERKKMVGGHELGTECCEVVIDYIIKRDAILPRPIGNVKTIGQAQGRTIAWPYKHMEVDTSKTKQASPPQGE